MKIAIPLNSTKTIGNDFMHASELGIYDTAENKLECISIKKEEANINLLYVMKQIPELECIITPSISFLALRIFKENNFTVYKADGIDVEKNIEKFLNNTLRTIQNAQAKIQECSSSGCSSCTSTCNKN